jgi:protein O-GlcNAcase/histone acetyltransferase
MSPSHPSGFLAGVIEGFYGPPWSTAERLELFETMSAAGLDTYFYCPKDDWKQRAIWREPYSEAEAAALADLVQACHRHRLRFVYALSPGLDLHYSRAEDLETLGRRFDQMLALGVGHFALLFDDIPDHLDPADLARWGSLASAQCHVANTVRQWVRERRPDGRFLFCPTPYCSRMVRAGLGGEGYLETVGRELAPDIDVLWTGPRNHLPRDHGRTRPGSGTDPAPQTAHLG